MRKIRRMAAEFTVCCAVALPLGWLADGLAEGYWAVLPSACVFLVAWCVMLRAFRWWDRRKSAIAGSA